MKKRIIPSLLGIIILCCFISCATKPYMPLSEVPSMEVLGEIEADFESNIKLNYGFLGTTGIIIGGVGGYFLGNGIGSSIKSSPSKEYYILGGGLIGTGIAFALIQDLAINRPKIAKINEAAREALLEAAKLEYSSEEIEIRDIKCTFVQQIDRMYKYNATGVVVKQEVNYKE